MLTCAAAAAAAADRNDRYSAVNENSPRHASRYDSR